MTGYNYTKRSVHTLLHGYNYTERSVHPLHDWLQLQLWLVTKRSVSITLKEVPTLFMAGYNYTKRSVHSLHGWLQLH